MREIWRDDFSGFPIGAFPYDPEHSAMGEYHYYPAKGYQGAWYDPITGSSFRGPSWIITEEGGKHYMEQTRLGAPGEHVSCPTLAAGHKDWKDYRLSVSMRRLSLQEPAGILFRYQTSLMHYALYLNAQKVQLARICKEECKILKEADYAYDGDRFYRLEAEVKGDRILVRIDGKEVLDVCDGAYAEGGIALAAYMPAQYTDVTVSMEEEEIERLAGNRAEAEIRLARKKADYPRPRLWKVIDLKNFGAGRQIRFGHLTGTEEMFFVMAQHQKRVFKDRYANISCLTAVSVETGEVLWQKGEPSENQDHQYLTADLPFQIYDIDGDGIDEVILARNFQLMILDGRDGSVKKRAWTPFNEEAPENLCNIEFGKHAFERLNVDAIRIVNTRGSARPEQIMIKDRYSRLYIYDQDLRLQWKFTHNNTGHFPYTWDFDGDGREEIFSCYNMISADGELRWELPIHRDHTDEILYGPIDPDGEEVLAIVSGWEGFMMVDREGRILVRDINGHGQRISAGNYCPGRPGLEICTTTYWGNQGILYLYDCKGREIWHKEPGSNGNIIAPVNWKGDGTELILLNGSLSCGGMLDGEGDRVVLFPDDGHPDLCAEALDLTGDSRDEIVLWDEKRMYIYTQEGEAPAGETEYRPVKYPHYNASNYRGEYAFPRWVKRQ